MNFTQNETNTTTTSTDGYYRIRNDITTTQSSTAASELDLMDSSPLHHHHHHPHHHTEIGAHYSGSTLGLGTGASMEEEVVEREHMFDKVVTPSDVGKLNRLVIPKQHAEKYFPLDSSTNDKGLLLNFEDSNGRSWRFRYSYWNSSQSYVMTKGWSRFVKDKKLDPGDIVSFHRGKAHLAKDRLFIDWRRRPQQPPVHPPPPPHQMPFGNHNFSIHPYYYFPAASAFQRSSPSAAGWSTTTPSTGIFFPAQAPGVSRGDHYYHPGQTTYDTSGTNYGQSINGISTFATAAGPAHMSGSHHMLNNPNPSGSSVIYFRSAAPHPHQRQASLEAGMVQFSSGSSGHEFGGGGGNQDVFLQSVPVVPGKAAAKRLRLFGVNMDCPISDSLEEEEDKDEGHDTTILASTSIGHHPHTLVVPPPSNLVDQLRSYSSGASSPQLLPHHHHQMQFQSDYLHDRNDNKGKGIQ